MASRKIVWTSTAKVQLLNILEYFNFRNKSKAYSQKLYRKIQLDLNALLLHPNIEKKANTVNVRGLLVENYFIFYELNEKHIITLSVWDTKQNPDKLKL